jgi:hypothetical protein
MTRKAFSQAVKEALETDAEMMANLRAIKGVEYADLVSALANLLNFNSVLVQLVPLEHLAEQLCDANHNVLAHLCEVVIASSGFVLSELMGDVLMIGKARMTGVRGLSKKEES